MHISRVMPALVDTGRLDPDYYNPVYLEDELKLKEFGCIELGKAGKFFAGPFGSKLPSNLYLDHGIPLFRVGNVGKMEVLTENFAHLDKFVHADLKASEVHPGDILIVKASVGEKICKVPDWIAKANITQHIIALRSNGRFDTDYVCSFLFSHYGVRQLTRRSLGSIIQYLGVNDSRTVLIPELREDAQKYIGNKVRQAETLRAWAKKLGEKITTYFDDLFKGILTQKPSALHANVFSGDLTTRINAEYYSEEYRQVERGLKKQFRHLTSIGDVAPVSKEKSKPKGDCVYFEIGDINISSGKILTGTFYPKGTAPNNAQRQFNHGDIAISTRRPNRGAIAVIEESSKEHFYSVFLVRLVPKSLSLSYWLKEYLRHDVGKKLLLQRCTWTTYPVISENDIETIPVPVLEEDWKTIGDWSKNRDSLLKITELLTTAAKLLTEALIEEKLTEQDLINAQQALDKGDTSRDQNILSRLATTGIDNNDSPLFPDLDQLYQLLKQADNPEEEE